MTTQNTLPSKPKDEHPVSIILRIGIIASFIVVIVFLGLPLWNLTTSIHRAPLDYSSMNHYDTSLHESVEIIVPVYINSAGTSLPDIVEATQLVINTKLEANNVPKGWRIVVHSIQDELKELKSDEFSGISSLDLIANEFEARGKKSDIQKAELLRSAYLVHLVPGQNVVNERAVVSKYSREMVISYTKESVIVADLPELVAVEIINVFGEEIDQFVGLVNSKSSNSVESDSSSKSLAASHSTHYHLTFSLFVQGGDPVGWNISSALQSYFSPLERQLSQKVANFSIDTQVQFYSTLTKLPREVTVSENPEKKQFIFTQDDLSTFVNFAEWSLSSIHSYPSLNFILYIPSKEYTPLLIEESKSNSFIIPQWGGVVIHNPLSFSSLYLDESDLFPILEIFSSQLLSLLGAPSHPAESPIYRLDILSRLFALRSLIDASSSLGSLSRLSASLPTISIPNVVAVHVDSALAAIANALEALKSQRWQLAINPAARVFQNAHSAFFEKEMVQQMYFPDEHKIAVYLPLLGPVLVVVLMGTLRTIKDVKTLKLETQKKDVEKDK